jgi:outer membrane protein W
MKKLFIPLMAMGLLSTSYAQQKSNFVMSYSIAMPAGSLSDYISSTSFRGISLEYIQRVTEKLDLGVESGWNVFYERVDNKVYTEGTASISGVQYRYTHAIPIILGGKFNFGGGSKVKPYGGLGLGTIYLNRNTEFGLYILNTDTWQFAVRPELGIRYEYAPGRGMLFGLKYYSASGNDDLDGQSFFSLNLGIVL